MGHLKEGNLAGGFIRQAGSLLSFGSELTGLQCFLFSAVLKRTKKEGKSQCFDVYTQREMELSHSDKEAAK